MKKKHYFYDDLGRQYYDYYEEEPSLFETLATWIFNLIAASVFAFIFVAILAVSIWRGNGMDQYLQAYFSLIAGCRNICYHTFVLENDSIYLYCV